MGKTGHKHLLREAILSTRESLMLTSQVEIMSNTHAVIQGTRGIISYGDDSIRIKLIDNEVQFYGVNLTIDCLSQDSMELKGKITRIEYLHFK